MGKYLSVWGVRLIYPAGFLLDGLSFVVFGLLHWVQDTNTFLVLSYLIRIVEGVGAAATWNSNLSILMAKFPERKASVKAWCDAAFNLGLTLGPVLGAAMYEAGGFCLPFAVTGAAIIVSGAAAYLVTEMPSIAPTEASQSVLSIAARPAVTVALLTATVAAYTIGTVEATLSTFLEASVAQVTVRTIAAAFLTMSLASVAATPLSGWLCDTRLCPWLVSCGGCLLMLACFTLLGPGKNIFIDMKFFRVLSNILLLPAPYLAPLLGAPTLASVTVSLVLQGVGSAAVLVASFSCAQLAAVTAGRPAAADTQAVVAGLFTSAFAAGNFFGPTISGVLYSAVGFSYNSLIIQCLLALFIFLNLGFYVRKLRTKTSLSHIPDIIPQ